MVPPRFGRRYAKEGSKPLAFFERIDLRVEPKPYSQEKWDAARPGDFLYKEVPKKGIVISD